jgi:hypothetical protein
VRGFKKNFKINFDRVENVSTFAIPNERGIKKHTGGARPKGTKTERFAQVKLQKTDSCTVKGKRHVL